MNSINSNPKVSVVMSCFNSSLTIAETITSVLSQSFKDFEFIIWDDGSTDDTKRIVETFNDKRIRYIYHKNTGLGKALYSACNEAKGKYIARIDADDICMPDRFEKQVQFLDSHPEVVLIGSSVIYIDEHGVILGRSYPATWSVCQKKHIDLAHPTVMFRTSVYKKTCGYSSLNTAQDKVLWPKFLKYGKICNLSAPLVKYRFLDNSIGRKMTVESPYFPIMKEMVNKMKKDDIVKDEDVEIQNKLYSLAQNKERTLFKYKKSKEEKLQSLLKIVIGDQMSTSFVMLCKNIYTYIKY